MSCVTQFSHLKTSLSEVCSLDTVNCTVCTTACCSFSLCSVMPYSDTVWPSLDSLYKTTNKMYKNATTYFKQNRHWTPRVLHEAYKFQTWKLFLRRKSCELNVNLWIFSLHHFCSAVPICKPDIVKLTRYFAAEHLQRPHSVCLSVLSRRVYLTLRESFCTNHQVRSQFCLALSYLMAETCRSRV